MRYLHIKVSCSTLLFYFDFNFWKYCSFQNPIPINRPNVEPKRPPRPVNISNWCKLCPSVANQVAVSWTPEYGRGYVISVNLVKKLTANDLLLKMKAKGIRHADFTTGLS